MSRTYHPLLVKRILSAFQRVTLNVGGSGVGVHNVMSNAGNSGAGVRDIVMSSRSSHIYFLRKFLLEAEI